MEDRRDSAVQAEFAGGRKTGADPDTRTRTYLANERTFLAWLRTGLSLSALGLGAAQFLERDLVPSIPLTVIFVMVLIASGTVMVAAAGLHHTHARVRIKAGVFRPALSAVVLAAVLIVIAGLLSVGLVVLLRLRG